MAEIHITAMKSAGSGGPSIPTEHSAFVGEIEIAGNKLPCLKMIIGDCTISVWPVDPEAVQSLGSDLVCIAWKLGGKAVNCRCGGGTCAGHSTEG